MLHHFSLLATTWLAVQTLADYKTWHLVDKASVFCPTTSMTSVPDAPNLALSKSVTCSSGMQQCGVAVVDGLTDCNLHSSSPNVAASTCDTQGWVQIDLGAAIQFNQVVLFGYACLAGSPDLSDQPKSFCGRKVDVSTDGTTWKTAYQVDSGYNVDATLYTNMTFPAETARYVRVYSSRSGAEGQARFLEVEVYNREPLMPEYSIGIQDGSELNPNYPHIFTVLRTSDQALTLSFTVTDATGKQVILPQTVTLGASTAIVSPPPGCTCTGATIPSSSTSIYGVNYGKSCSDWDNTKCSTLWGDKNPGTWCCKKWCYASSSCPDAVQSELVTGQSFSYAACASSAPLPNCSWTSVAQQKDPCQCRAVGHIMNTQMKAKFALDYGSSCKSWDIDTCDTNYLAAQLDDWCCSKWCYVDKACTTSIPSYNPGMDGLLFWSKNTCPEDARLISQCPYQKLMNATSANLAKCACVDTAMPTSALPAGAPADYGRTCKAHDADKCDVFYPNAQREMWCCKTWCFVDEQCPNAKASMVWPGHFFSEVPCTADRSAVLNCKYSNACACTNNNTGVNLTGLPNSFGKYCHPWDGTFGVSCYNNYGPNSSNPIWNTSGTNDWCCDSWCYVSDGCPLTEESNLGAVFSYSYDACTDSGLTYKAGTDSCGVRRLEGAEDEFVDELSSMAGSAQDSGAALPWAQPASRPAQRGTGQGRRLSAPPRRGKGGGGGGGSRGGGGGQYSSPMYTTRRRTPSRPVAAALRRRATGGTATNYGPRRRNTMGSGVRRRTTSLSGTSQTTGGASNVPYGYTSRPQLMSQYGGNMPAKTNYGYSGANAVKSGSTKNMALGAAGGFAAGVGAYYMYNSVYGSHYSIFRRRRSGPVQWCVVPDGAAKAGQIMECHDCYQSYGFCESTSKCFGEQGCSYKLPADVNRDDLTSTGFVPKDFTFPLKVVFTSISGDGITRADVCPPTTEAEYNAYGSRAMSFSADLFVTLTQMDILGDPAPYLPTPSPSPTCRTQTGYSCKSSGQIGQEGLTACYGEAEICDANRECSCKGGWCLEGSGQTAACHPAVASGADAVRAAWWFYLTAAAVAAWAVRPHRRR